jgi:membrane protease YdiL (CAAX protease family)
MRTSYEMKGIVGRNAGPPETKVKRVELAVFLFLIVPPMLASLFLTSYADLRFTPVAISSILSNLALMSLIFYFIWRNGESLGQIGWKSKDVVGDIGWGVLLYFPILFGIGFLERLLHAAGFSAPKSLPSFLTVNGPGKIVLASILVTVVAIAEETIFRGYLIHRFKALTGSTAAAVLFSSLIFAVGHGYEGMAGMISIFVLGLIFALIYLWRKSLVAPMVMHFLTDFVSIVVAALLAIK